MSSAVSVAAISTSIRSGGGLATSGGLATVAAAAPAKKSSVVPAESVKVNSATQPAKPGAAQKTVSPKASPPPPAATTGNPDLPLGLLLSASRPPTGNVSASSDYVAMENALRTGNLTNAQQAYMRLQSDLQLEGNTASATEAANPAADAGLNATA